MAALRTYTFLLMDAPFESSRTAAALRIIDAAIRRGHNVNVFAYEGAVLSPFRDQQPNANPVHGHDVDEDERGAGDTIEGIKRGSPADFWAMVSASDNTLVVPTA